MKYIDAEKLKAEIERRLEKYDPDYTSAGFELKELLSFIDSLQHEQPEPTEGIKGNLEEIPSNVDLEKDVESWFFNEISPKINVENTMYHYFQECAHRYYNLGINARKEE